jgi:organic radical activating enzyme
MGGHSFPEIPCIICSKPVDLMVDLIADENGGPVHEDCYLKRTKVSSNRGWGRYYGRITKETMNDKSTATMSGTVDKIIESAIPNEPDKAQVTVAGGDPLYRELRIVNALTKENGEEVSLKTGQNVIVTVEANSKDTNKQ